MLLNSEKLNVLHKLSVAFVDIRKHGGVAPLFEVIEETSTATAVHSIGVSAVARTMAEQSNLDGDICRQLALSGLLHDIGKITIPDSVINKAGPLSAEEGRVMRAHVEMTYRILKAFDVPAPVLRYCVCHHERLSGTGYPFGLDAPFLDLGCRIMSVADVFVALTENRIYRKGMSRDKAVAVIEYMVAQGSLDETVFLILKSSPERFDDARMRAQLQSTRIQAA